MSNNGLIDGDVWPKPIVQIITSSTMFSWMPGATHASFLVIGGGGGGGSGKFDGINAANGGSGGSGGSLRYMRRMPYEFINALRMRNEFTVTIGAGGTGGAGVTISGNNGNPGVAGGSSSIQFRTQWASGIYGNLFYTSGLTVNGGGKGTGGTSSFANADASSNGAGQLNGLTGGQGSATATVSMPGHSTNSFGTNPFHWIAVNGGQGAPGKGSTSYIPFGHSSVFYGTGGNTGQLNNVDGISSSVFAHYIERQVKNFKEAPVMEELAWITTTPGGSAGAGGTTGIGGNGGNGYWGSGGGGSGGTGALASGNGGKGGNGVVVIWWEKLQ